MKHASVSSTVHGGGSGGVLVGYERTIRARGCRPAKRIGADPRRSKSGSLAIFAAMRRASSVVKKRCENQPRLCHFGGAV
jgi:hypothetical protein